MWRLRHGLARAFLVRSESFEEDAAALWEWLCVPEEARAEAHRVTMPGSTEADDASSETPEEINVRHDDKAISAAGMAQLREHTQRERYALEALEGLADNGIHRSATASRRERVAAARERTADGLLPPMPAYALLP